MARSITLSRGNGHVTLVDHIIVRGELIQVQARARSLKTAKVRLIKKIIARFASV